MKKISLLLLCLHLYLGIFAQKNTIQILENQGDSLFLAGEEQQASVIYFKAFYQNIKSKRLQDKFGLKNMDLYFSHEKLKTFYIRDSIRIAYKNLIENSFEEVEKLSKSLELEKALEVCQKIRYTPDSTKVKEKINDIKEKQKYLETVSHDTLVPINVHVKVHIINGITEEFIDADLEVENELTKKHYIPIKLSEGIYKISLPIGKYVFTSLKTNDFEKSKEQVEFLNTQLYDSIVFIRVYGACHGLWLDNINFERHQKILSEISVKTANDVKTYLTDFPLAKITIRGHASLDEKNARDLSLKRAVEVANYLVNQGIIPSRLNIEAYGKDRLLVPNDSENNKKLNRRVDFGSFR